MKELWEQTFNREKTSWGFESSDSAIKARDFFLKHDIHKILIPGAGYGRNAIPFIQAGFNVTGIEIAGSAIRLARKHNINFPIHEGSVLDMPFDKEIYDGIFCYALIHLLNKPQRKTFLKSCYNQLKINGYMIFMAVSIENETVNESKLISKNRYKLPNGLSVFFYEDNLVHKEFSDFGLVDFEKIDEPIKHMKDLPPIKCYFIICKKN